MSDASEGVTGEDRARQVTERASGIRYRGASPDDARAIHSLVEEGGVLELNTTYSYLLMCDHFASTTVVAEHEGRAVGFVTAYRPPSRPESVFVWQIGVHPRMRGRRIARGLLEALVRRPGCRGVRFLEATVTPSNEPSRRLFTSFARRMDVPSAWSRGYDGALLGDEGEHEPEHLVRIGPLTNQKSLS